MTRVQGNLKIVTGAADDVTEVWVRAARARPVTGGWLMTADDHHPVSGGVVDLELLPGACVLVAVTAGEPGEKVEMIVPESGTASLEACIRAAESAGELERNALDELRQDMAAWIDEARASAGAADGSAKAAKAEADKAKGSADAAGKSATSAAGSASAAKTSADSAGKSASAADGSATAAEKARSDASSFANSAKTASEQATASAQQAADSASAAKADAGKAATSATNADNSAKSTKADADRAKVSADSASTSASGAKSSADAAKGSADAAGKSATAAASSASTAKADAGKAATSATNASNSAKSAKADADRAVGVVDSVQWNDDKLTVAGKTSPSLRGPKGDPGGVKGVAVQGSGADPLAEGAKSLAVGWETYGKGTSSVAIGYAANAEGDHSTAIGNYSKASAEGATAIGTSSQASADCATAIGPGHRVTVPGETHIGVPNVFAKPLGVPSRVVLHGTAETTEPATAPEHLVGKGYVDGAVGSKADKSYVDSKGAETKAYVDEVRARVESRPAFFSGVGAPPSTIPGAVVGDYYLNETTMELHKITGV